MTDIKKWYTSRQLWTAGVALAIGMISIATGQQVTAGETATILGFIMIVLRLITNTEIDLVSTPLQPPTV